MKTNDFSRTKRFLSTFIKQIIYWEDKIELIYKLPLPDEARFVGFSGTGQNRGGWDSNSQHHLHSTTQGATFNHSATSPRRHDHQCVHKSASASRELVQELGFFLLFCVFLCLCLIMKRFMKSDRDQVMLFSHTIADNLEENHEVYAFAALLDKIPMKPFLSKYSKEGSCHI